MVVSEDVGFPFAYLLENPVTGEVENRIATFMLQSFAAWGILAALVGYMLWRRGKRIPGGHIALLFTLCYCASQIVLDSTRYDALVLRSNGFVSMVQILGCVGLLVPVVIFSGIYLRAGCKKGVGAAVWAAMACMLGLAGYMEYFVQNTREKAFLAYGIMTLAMGIVVALTLLLRKMTMDKLEAALSAADTND